MLFFLLHIVQHDFEYTGTVQSLMLEAGSAYVLECWGAQGGDVSASDVKYRSFGSKGGYSRGTLTPAQQTNVFIFVGGKGDAIGLDVDENLPIRGGWNGGGSGYTIYNNIAAGTRYHPRPGGGATDISLSDSEVSYSNDRTERKNYKSINDRLIVAGGGAGANTVVTNLGAVEQITLSKSDAVGGGQSGGGGVPGTQSAHTHASAGFGYGGNTDISGGWFYGGGGSGYNGGGSGEQDGRWSGGGSGFVKVSGMGVVLDGGLTIAGDQDFPSPGGPNETGHAGHGHVRITCLSCVVNPTAEFSFNFIDAMHFSNRYFIVGLACFICIAIIQAFVPLTDQFGS